MLLKRRRLKISQHFQCLLTRLIILCWVNDREIKDAKPIQVNGVGARKATSRIGVSENNRRTKHYIMQDFIRALLVPIIKQRKILYDLHAVIYRSVKYTNTETAGNPVI